VRDEIVTVARKRYYILMIALLLFLATHPPDGMVSGVDSPGEEIERSLLVSVQKAIGYISDVWGREDPVFPPVDASSLIRQYEQGLYSDNGPTRANPIPANWDQVAINSHSRIYVEEGISIPSDDIQALGDIFDDAIYPNSTDWFHPDNPYESIDIRIYDFGDGPGNTGGFFLGSYPTRNDLFVDSQDLLYSRSWSFEIVAHEFQHLLHYDLDPDEEIWLNEGLADLSARVSLGPGTGGIQSHIDAYEIYPENDLLTWNEGQPPDYIETIADYGRAYAFVSYLADHYGGKVLIQDIVEDQRNSIYSINGELAEDGISERFNDIVIGEKVANLVDDPVYGGGVFDQGLIDIGIRSFEKQTSSYPALHRVSDTVRYSGYYLRYVSGSPDLSISFESSSGFHASLISMTGGDIRGSVNLTVDTGSAEYKLTGFGVDYDQLFVILHTEVAGLDIDVEVEISDLEPPVTEVMISPPEPTGKNGYYLEPPGISLETSEGSDVMYSWDGETFREYSSALHPPEGSSTLSFYSSGPFGLREETRQIDFRVDTLDPITSISIDPPSPDGENGFYITDPLVTISTEVAGDIPYYDLGNGARSYDGPFQPGHGQWDIMYWSEDSAGRMDEKKIVNIDVDLADPEVDIGLDPRKPDGSGGYYTSSPTITLDIDEGSTGWFYLNDEGPYEYSYPFALEDGEWEVRYHASTPSGRLSPMEAVYLKVDTSPPNLRAVFDPPLCSGWCSESTYLSLETGDETADIWFTLGDEGPFSYNSPVLLGDGEYEIDFWAEDPAGNRAQGGPIEIMVDNTPPVTEVVADRYPDSGDWYYDWIPDLEFRTTLPQVSPEMTLISLDGDTFIEYSGQTIDLLPGRNTLYFYSQDLAGNRENVRSKEINIDMSRPSGSLEVNRTLISQRGPVRFSIDGSTDDIDIYRFSLDFGDGTTSDWIYGTEATHTYGKIGVYRVSLTVEDMAGRTNEEEVTVTIEVLTREEYNRRMEGDGPSLPILILSSVLVLLATASMAALVVVLIKRRRNGYNESEIEWEMEDR
jgi:hypothetical protein